MMDRMVTRSRALPRLATVGYEGRTLDELLTLLAAARIEVLVDVRENAVSRKPGLSKRRLSAALDLKGIAYRHEPLLGNPRANRDGFRRGKQRARSRYLRHLNNGSRAAYESVIELTKTTRVALLCFEREHATCHRSCIAEQALRENPRLRLKEL